MKKRITIISIIISAVMLFSSCGLFGGGETVLPEYNEEKEMFIGAWLEPINTLEDYQTAKDMGLTHLFLGATYTGGVLDNQKYFEILDFCDQVGLKALIRSVNDAAFYSKYDDVDFSEYPAAAGINYWDEPFEADFSKVASLAERHVEKYGDKLTFFINLPPNETNANWQPWPETSNYKNYVNKFAADVLSKVTVGEKILSCDVYPIVERQQGGQVVRIIKSTWLSCLERIALSARAIGAKTQFFIQGSAFSNAGDHGTGMNFPSMTEADLRFQFFTEMAFGIQGFTYFTYNEYRYNDFHIDGLVTMATGEKRPQYEYAKTVNAELKALQNVYLSFTWQGTMPIVGDDNASGLNPNFLPLDSPLESIPFIKECSASQDALLGVFKDKNGYNGLIATNFTDPNLGLSNTLKLKFNKARKVMVYTMGIERVIDLKDNTFEFALDPGQGAFIIPIE